MNIVAFILLILSLFGGTEQHTDKAPAPAPVVNQQPVTAHPAKPHAVKHHAAKPKPKPQPTREPNEDEYGWNCFVHGNGSCGELPLDEQGCAVAEDGYEMCPDGTVNDGDPDTYQWLIEHPVADR
jgi:hypothetical protein